jgi:hypothetical protein
LQAHILVPLQYVELFFGKTTKPNFGWYLKDFQANFGKFGQIWADFVALIIRNMRGEKDSFYGGLKWMVGCFFPSF